MKAFRTVLCLVVALAIAGGAIAEDVKKSDAAKKGDAAKKADGEKRAKGDAAKKRDAARKGKKRDRKAPALSAQLLRGIELTAEQKKAVEPFDKEFGPKFAELQKSQRGLLTEEQQKARAAIFAKIRKSDSKRATPELRKELAAAVTLSDEQKAKQAEIRKAQNELRTAYLAKVNPILTDEQKTKLKGRGRGGDRKRPAKGDAAGKKPAPKKDGAKKDAAKKDAAKKPSKDGAATASAKDDK